MISKGVIPMNSTDTSILPSTNHHTYTFAQPNSLERPLRVPSIYTQRQIELEALVIRLPTEPVVGALNTCCWIGIFSKASSLCIEQAFLSRSFERHVQSSANLLYACSSFRLLPEFDKVISSPISTTHHAHPRSLHSQHKNPLSCDKYLNFAVANQLTARPQSIRLGSGSVRHVTC